MLPSRQRACAPLTLFVNSALGADLPTNGQAPLGGAFATPGYALAWASVNLDMAGQLLTVAIDRIVANGEDVPYVSNPAVGNNGTISLRDVLGCPTSWTDPNAPVICGAVNGVPIPDAAWGSGNPGPLIVGNAAPYPNAVCGVGVSTIWRVKNMQVMATGNEIEADRDTRINVSNLICGGLLQPYPAQIKFCASYGGNIELLGPCYSNSPGALLCYAANGSGIIGAGNIYVNPGCASTHSCDATSYIN